MIPTNILEKEIKDSLLKIRDMIDSPERDMAILGATVFFNSLSHYERHDLFGHSASEKKMMMIDGSISDSYRHAKSNIGQRPGQEMFFRRGNYCLYKAWGVWIYEPLTQAAQEIRMYREHIDLNGITP